MRTQTKLLAVSLVFLFTLILTGSMGIHSINEMKTAFEKTYQDDFVPMHLIAEANHALIVLHREMLTHILDEDVNLTGNFQMSMLEHKNILQDKIERLSSLKSLTEEEWGLIRDIDEGVKQILPLSEELILIQKSGDPEDTKRRILSEVKPHLERLDTNMNRFLEIQKLEAVKALGFMYDRYNFYFDLGWISLSTLVASWILVCTIILWKSKERNEVMGTLAERMFKV